jgi:hypothetical protein
MGKDAQGSVVLNDAAQKKFDECVAALTAMRWPDGPPKDTTFAEIEAFGHEVGRMLGRAVDEKLTTRHSEQFQHTCACPTCKTECDLERAPVRQIQTSDGLVPLKEPLFHCSVCNRDFFPSACSTKD